MSSRAAYVTYLHALTIQEGLIDMLFDTLSISIVLLAAYYHIATGLYYSP